ncbi:MAG: pantoate--beta-alanine ligase [Neisseriaceae bacterium]|nr:pantoate--beta-alanine ligase [Neisseriaceae bacterium]
MHIFHNVAEWITYRNTLSSELSLGFAPTMGNLHAGHLSLVAEAKKHAQHVAVSIFVNRLQFGQGEDFEAYPRTNEADIAQLILAGVDVLFLPTEATLYPNSVQAYQVEPPELQSRLEGAFRPGHFRGVATVVLKLFNIVQPNVACFGRKDFQQLIIIQGMVADLNVPVRIIAVDTERAPDGLALSSRNGYLTSGQRALAPQLYQELCGIRAAILAGDGHFADLCQQAMVRLTQQGWVVDYLTVCDAHHLLPIVKHTPEALKEKVILATARLGETRLLDNLTFVL